eukprot:gb/GECH01013183.1/.p1 GENE.gb/GECH01013183.1/~~gb/GECH01013183.1/.p1  ORF type:complete len:105 (+),score=27.60 gb/GECH01013183.1/:1-315(+)
MKILYMDFPFPNGPWGEEMLKVCKEMAEDIAKQDGLVWKIWTENKEKGEAGGIYLFKNEELLNKYVEMHKKRLAGFGIETVNAKIFDVNEPLSDITRGPYHTQS